MKITSLILCALLSSLSNAYAQRSAQSQEAAPASEEPLSAMIARANDSSTEKPRYINDINMAAVRDFVKRFTTTADPEWTRITGDCYEASFTQPGMKCHAYYSKRGRWLCTLRTYKEKLLPHDVRHIVKSNYYDFAITGITEVEHYNIPGTVYIVYLEDEKTYLNLQVYDGGIEVMQRLEKIGSR